MFSAIMSSPCSSTPGKALEEPLAEPLSPRAGRRLEAGIAGSYRAWDAAPWPGKGENLGKGGHPGKGEHLWKGECPREGEHPGKGEPPVQQQGGWHGAGSDGAQTPAAPAGSEHREKTLPSSELLQGRRRRTSQTFHLPASGEENMCIYRQKGPLRASSCHSADSIGTWCHQEPSAGETAQALPSQGF